MTIEGALTIPLLFVVMGIFLFFFQVFFIQSRMEAAIDSAGRKWATYWYGVELLQDYRAENKEDAHSKTLIDKIGIGLVEDGITTLYVKNQVLKQYGENALLYQAIDGGKKGISFLGSGLTDGGTVLKIMVTYKIKIPLVPGISFSCVQSCWKRLWTGEGYDIEEAKEEEELLYVYVTKNGAVYHSDLNCSHLKRTISTVTSNKLSAACNELGQRYDACELCCEKNGSYQLYYITKTGTKYHVTLECSALTRYIEKRLFSEIGNLAGCSRCSQT